MQRDTKKNYQLYGRNDMIMLDEHNKIYGSLGMAEPYIVATKEGETLLLDGAKDDEPFIGLSLYGKSHQNTVAGNQLFDAPEESATISGVNYSKGENGGIQISGTAESGGARKNSYFTENKILLKAGTYTLCGYCDNGAGLEFGLENLSLEVINGFVTANTPKQYTFSEDTEVIVFVQVVMNGTVNQEVFIMLNAGTTALSWEPYTGGQPSPNPDYPQEIKSVGDSGTINVSLSDGGSQNQTLPVQTPNGLPGIPVDSGGNYTDADGQQWVCDEVDFKRGVYVQRVKRARLMGNVTDNEISLGRYSISVGNIFGIIANSRHYIITSNARTISPISQGIQGQIFQYSNGVYWYCTDWFASKEDLETFLDENNVTIIGHLAAPIETPLSPSDLAAYSALRTYSPTTVVSNDAGAWMKAIYKQIENGG